MKKWKIDFLEIFNLSKKMKKENERKITKYQKMGGARFARAPPIFCFFEFFWRFPFSFFLEKLEISRKSIFHFSIFSIFGRFVHCYRFSLNC